MVFVIANGNYWADFKSNVKQLLYMEQLFCFSSIFSNFAN